MTPTQIAADVDRGIAIAAQVKELQSELKIIEKRLEQAALEGVTYPLQDEGREGRQFPAEGTAATLPIIIESDQVVASIPDGGELHGRLLRLAAGKLAAIWRPVSKLERIAKDGKAYRAALLDHFPAETAAEILASTLQRDKHGVPKSRIIIRWDRAKPRA